MILFEESMAMRRRQSLREPDEWRSPNCIPKKQLNDTNHGLSHVHLLCNSWLNLKYSAAASQISKEAAEKLSPHSLEEISFSECKQYIKQGLTQTKNCHHAAKGLRTACRRSWKERDIKQIQHTNIRNHILTLFHSRRTRKAWGELLTVLKKNLDSVQVSSAKNILKSRCQRVYLPPSETSKRWSSTHHTRVYLTMIIVKLFLSQIYRRPLCRQRTPSAVEVSANVRK